MLKHQSVYLFLRMAYYQFESLTSILNPNPHSISLKVLIDVDHVTKKNTFPFLCRLKIHVRNKHNEKKPFIKCNICGFETNIKIYANNHHQIFHNKKKMEEILGSSNYNDCPFCPETSKTKKMLMDHIFKDHGYQKEYITTANASVSNFRVQYMQNRDLNKAYLE